MPTNWRTRWGRRHRRLYVRHRMMANMLMVGLMLLGLAVRDTTAGWAMAGAPLGRGPIGGYLMVRPPTADGSSRGSIRFEPAGPKPGLAGAISAMLPMGQRPEAVEAATSHGGRWSMPASALRRGWTYRIETQAGECPAGAVATIDVPILTGPRVPPLTATSCR